MNRKILLTLAVAAAATLTASPALARDRHHGEGHQRGGHGGLNISIGGAGGYYGGGYGGGYGGYGYPPQRIYYADRSSSRHLLCAPARLL